MMQLRFSHALSGPRLLNSFRGVDALYGYAGNRVAPVIVGCLKIRFAMNAGAYSNVAFATALPAMGARDAAE